MVHRVNNVPGASVSPPSPASRVQGRSFAEVLQQTREEAPSLARTGEDLLRRVAAGERYTAWAVREGLRGRGFSNEELLVLQARIYRYTQEVDLVAKLVDRAGTTVKTVLQNNG
jgi:hypothetical protein